jgi:hypothetical protein
MVSHGPDGEARLSRWLDHFVVIAAPDGHRISLWEDVGGLGSGNLELGHGDVKPASRRARALRYEYDE